MAPRRFSVATALGFILLPALAFVVFRGLEAHAAVLWTEYYVLRGPERRGTEEALKAGRSAARAIDLGAPLPDAATAAALSLDLARAFEPQNPEAALALVSGVRAALDQARSSRFRGWGLEAFDDDARVLEERLQPRVTRRP